MTEDFLHYIWKLRLYDPVELKAHTGEAIEIIKTGSHNRDQGPDFFDAMIKIGETTWAGNVELHMNSSDWEKHNHTLDKAYDNVVLHVVYNNDKEIKRTNGEAIPTLALREKINPQVLNRYLNLYQNKQKISCASRVAEVDPFLLENWLNRMLFNRLERKSTIILGQLKQANNDWQEVFYRRLALNFGFKINAGPFEMLARSLPFQYLGKHRDNLLQTEALLFGQAGLLERDFSDPYPLKLQKEYLLLRHKFSLKPIDAHLWKFMRLRPKNFPTIRLAQFAMLAHKTEHLFAKILQETELSGFYKIFSVGVSDYWLGHYMFEKPSEIIPKPLGKSSIDNFLINTVVPFLFVYGAQKGEEHYKDRAIGLLERISGERNHITKEWEEAGLNFKNAFFSQALIELRNILCVNKQCLNCAVGNQLLKTESKSLL